MLGAIYKAPSLPTELAPFSTQRALLTAEQPQRPKRSIRIGDENAPPQELAGKTLHHRNKSMSALSTLIQVGGVLKPSAAKRTAFADVSNTTKQPAKDDMQISGKTKHVDVLKDPAIVSAKEASKPTALARPAQRPLATITSKANASSGSNDIAAVASRQAHADKVNVPNNIRKVLSKKATTIFREPQVDLQGPVINTSAHTTSARTVVEPTELKAIKEVAVAVQDPALTQVNIDAAVKAKDTTVEEKDVQVHEKPQYLDALEEQARVIEQDRNQELAQSQPIQRPEPEEYWDEEEDEEYYDADGYTTGRSLRSRGDTTGGVTLVLAPRATMKSQRELDNARHHVLTTRTDEDIEDEQWDTSMVAEYGEEIFEYMRELEVSLLLSVAWPRANVQQERLKPNATYMDHQSEIQWSMRSVATVVPVSRKEMRGRLHHRGLNAESP